MKNISIFRYVKQTREASFIFRVRLIVPKVIRFANVNAIAFTTLELGKIIKHNLSSKVLFFFIR